MHFKLHDLAKKKSVCNNKKILSIRFFLENWEKMNASTVIERQYQICILFRPEQMFDSIGEYESCSTAALNIPPNVVCRKCDACTLSGFGTTYRFAYF